MQTAARTSNQDDLYEKKLARKQAEINKSVDDYRLAVMKARHEESVGSLSVV